MKELFITENEGLLNQVLNYAFLAGILLFLSTILFLVIRMVLIRINKQKPHELITEFRYRIHGPLIFLLVFLSFNIPVGFIGFDESFVRPLSKLLTILIIISISWMGVRLVRMIKLAVTSRYDISEKDNLQARKVYTQFRIIENIMIFVIVLIAMALILMSFETIRKIGVTMIASAGITSIILGFAAQKMIATILAGIQIAITQPIRLEDALLVEGEWGWVEEITLTYVVIRIWDKRRLVLPTTYFIETPFQNWTRTSAEIMGTVFLYTDYNVPFDAIRKELTRLLGSTHLWDGKVNVLQVTDATEKTVEIRILVSAENSPTAWDLRVMLREKLIEFLQKNYPESLPRTRIFLSRENRDKGEKSIPENED